MLKSGIRLGLLLSLLLVPACRKRPVSPTGGTTAAAPVAELPGNQMAKALPGLLSSRAGSPVRWQHWEPAMLQTAKDTRRPVFAVIGSARYPGCVETLDAIDKDSSLVKRLNENFVPVLVELELSPEAGLAAAVLSEEIRKPLSFPFILVLSPDGDEVSWRPVPPGPEKSLREMVESALETVAQMWVDSPDYVVKNSRKDHDARVLRLQTADAIPADPAARDALLARAVRQLLSLYEPDTGVMSGAGGLLPVGILQCLASASLDPDTPPEISKRCREVVAAFGHPLLASAMVDPLDGGVYSSRRSGTWDLPNTPRNCATQARSARALVTLHRATGDPLPLEVALGAVKFAEGSYATPTGLFAAQRLPGPSPAREWLWTEEQIDQALTPPEAALWKTLCGIAAIGNLPMEADSAREYFRLNSLGRKTTLAEAAAKQGITLEAAAELLKSSRPKLLKARLARVPERLPCPAPSAAASFRMVSAYAALFTATGHPEWRSKALALAKLARDTFAAGNRLREQNPGAPATTYEARAFTHALAIQAALDLAEITLDENWRIWAGDLTASTAEAFVDDAGRLTEARPDATPLTTPFADRMMLFDDSTAGLMRMNLARLAALGQSPPPALAPWLNSLPPIADAPVVFTDSILAAAFARSRVIIQLPENAGPEWREAASRLPLDRIGRSLAKVPAAKLLRPDGSSLALENPAAIEALARPAVP
ncbi:DUF255 domain-containing protein [Luteolibacter sp. Populi]|uniref:DUF255 domain-containing protein n=1 Tax=Luteolibacter sp. Populi TaxID=3230487 RepID=UPI003467AD5D